MVRTAWICHFRCRNQAGFRFFPVVCGKVRRMNMADGKDMMLSDSEKGSVAKMCRNVVSQNGILEKPCGIAAGIAVTGDAAAKKKAPCYRGLMKKECVAVPWSKHLAAYTAFPLQATAYFLYDVFILRDVLLHINQIKWDGFFCFIE